jgi:hypothetical protein
MFAVAGGLDTLGTVRVAAMLLPRGGLAVGSLESTMKAK